MPHYREITVAHYDELQQRLDRLYPDRHTERYFAQAGSAGVLSAKLEVLRNLKPPLMTPAPELAPHADNDQAKNNEEDDNDDLRFLFLITIQYLDLPCLRIRRCAFLIRDEYTMTQCWIPWIPRSLVDNLGHMLERLMFIFK